MKPLARILDWVKYERLHHYPELAVFDRDDALKRLLAHEREERQRWQRWLPLLLLLNAVLTVAWMYLAYVYPLARAMLVIVLIPGWLLLYILHRRIRRGVAAKVAAELRDGRLWKCVDCDYDLRASEERCPECGAPVRVASAAPTADFSANSRHPA